MFSTYTVKDLRIEAGIAGDDDMVATCDRWLAGEHTDDDVAAIAATIEDAAAHRAEARAQGAFRDRLLDFGVI
jgi:hypothetical protein